MQNITILNIISKAKEFLNSEQLNLLRIVLEDEFKEKENNQSTDLIVATNVFSYIGIYLTCKKVDGLSNRTLESYKQHLSRFATHVGKNIEAIDSLDIRKFLALCMKNNLKDTSMATEISILKVFFKWMKNEEYITKNPMEQINNIKINKFIRKALSQKEIELMRDACKTTKEKALFEFLYSTGCRLDEAYKVNRSDINWQTLSLIVCGKGNKERIVYLTSRAEVLLLKYLETRQDDKCALFINDRKPKDRMGRRSIQKMISQIGKRAKINKPVYPHIIRHSMATVLLNNGSSLAEVQRILGHENPSTTLIYSQLNNETIQQSHRKHIA